VAEACRVCCEACAGQLIVRYSNRRQFEVCKYEVFNEIVAPHNGSERRPRRSRRCCGAHRERLRPLPSGAYGG